jgi:hypothetical protein
MRRILLALGLACCATAAFAHPPKDADPALAPWFNSLTQPGTGISCCAEADCRRTDYRIENDHYEAFINGEWTTVPPRAVLNRMDNPTGQAVVCYTPTLGIMCFVRGPET